MTIPGLLIILHPRSDISNRQIFPQKKKTTLMFLFALYHNPKCREEKHTMQKNSSVMLQDWISTLDKTHR